jgi:hypothetical protein
MEHSLSPARRDDCIARARHRRDAIMARMSQAQVLLVEARARLALSRLTPKDATGRGASDPLRGDTTERSWHAEDDSGTARGAGGV